jgi:hypothetical protein
MKGMKVNIKGKKNSLVRLMNILTVIFLVGLISAAGVSCNWTIGLVRGSGDIRTEERDVSDFHKVHLSGVGDLIITQGEKESLLIETDDNIIPLIETEVSAERLSIGFRRGYNFVPTSDIKFYLTVKELDEILLSGAGSIKCEDFDTEELEIEISGAGDIDFRLDADLVRVNSSGAGGIEMSGKVDRQEIDLSGAGKYDAEELESRECEITVSGAGSATVNVSQELDVDISGVGGVEYKGSPTVQQNIKGLGAIRSID